MWLFDIRSENTVGSLFDPARKHICHLCVKGCTQNSQEDKQIHLDLNMREITFGAKWGAVWDTQKFMESTWGAPTSPLAKGLSQMPFSVPEY